MTWLGGISFSAPWLLLGLLTLPLLWLILRAVPPAPVRQIFPAVSLLIGLSDQESTSDRTPWWLLLLRMLAITALIVGFAGLILNPSNEPGRDGPVLILIDGSWAGAPNWANQIDLATNKISAAGDDGRPVAVVQLSQPEKPVFMAAADWRRRLAGLQPDPWLPNRTRVDQFIGQLSDARFDTIWISDGLNHSGREQLLAELETRGRVVVHQSAHSPLGLLPAQYDDGLILLTAQRSEAKGSLSLDVVAKGPDPAGIQRNLAVGTIKFEAGEIEGWATLNLPSELRQRITHFEIPGQRSSGAVTLADDGLRRREVVLISARQDREGLELLSAVHYLENALSPTTEITSGSLMDVLPSNPDVIVLADIATLATAETEAVGDWIKGGGLLLRFAGPRLAASDVGRQKEDPLIPVRLRSGGRTVGGAMSWGEPKTLAPFQENSPFSGLRIPDDVTVTTQIMAHPDTTLTERVIATLSDGTPLVTRKRLGNGQIVLFHIAANAEWSTLPLSGLFVEMLERLAVSSSTKRPVAADLEGTTWNPIYVLDGYGNLLDAGNRPGIAGPSLLTDPLNLDLLPGLYQSENRYLARNTLSADDLLSPANWPAHIPVSGFFVERELPIAALLIALASVLFLVDVLATLALSGRLATNIRPQTSSIVAVFLVLAAHSPAPADEHEDFAVMATSNVVLAYILTGDSVVDRVSQAGLRGLSRTLQRRTSVEPHPPVGIDLEQDELAFFPILLWPITADQAQPSEAAYSRLNSYLRTGGLIMFDTRDANTKVRGITSPNEQRLSQLAEPLDMPPLEILPEDHVLSRAFYLLQDFPGRHNSRAVWVEAAPDNAERAQGMPFRNLNDGVTPVIIGGNDWASAWAIDEEGRAMFPIGRGSAGQRQRELSYRFGVNLVMHVLTGNYKSDQVHVPALLDRLGQ
ncbi:MAG: DUF4159 domain-containing protein [Aestuariivita sp.]|nr:DUF4159 domain-containing protein [Aestuariivita sp.]MCY4201276.1 DUF4159 domain-containing protein [Aestuariivita sp.]